MDFDLEDLRLTDRLSDCHPPKKPQPPRHCRGEAFLKGPIPLDWVRRSGGLPGKALAVGLLLWWRAGCERSKTFCYRHSLAAERMGIQERTARRALQSLERAGLVSVRHLPGQRSEVTILPAGD